MSCLIHLSLCRGLLHTHQDVYGFSKMLSRNGSSLHFLPRLCRTARPMAMPIHTQIQPRTQTNFIGRGVYSGSVVHSGKRALVGDVRRSYSTDPEREQKPPAVQGKVVGLPNPINWIRNKMSLYLIHRYMDSNFTYEEFTAGAKQATLIVMNHLSRKDFDGMRDLVAPEVIESLKEFTANWVTKQWEAVSIKEEDIQFTAPKVASIKPENDKYHLAIELLVVAFKSTSADASLVEVTTQFQRLYSSNVTTEWIVSNIGPLKIRTYDAKDGQLR